METALLATLIPLTFAGGWLYTSRLLFARWRPYTEPLSCSYGYGYGTHTHGSWCYSRGDSGISSRLEAAIWAASAAMLWPAALVLVAAAFLIMRGTSPCPEETAAKIARLEKELKMRGAS